MVSVNPNPSSLDNNNSNNGSSPGNASYNATDPYGAHSVLHTVRIEEVLILAIMVSLWIVAVFSFLKKWSSIRILQPVEPRYRHKPKNLENVRVVKRAQDSVIYKNYSRKMSVTILARENKRLQRMHTVPIMSSLPPSLPTIAMETNTTEM